MNNQSLIKKTQELIDKQIEERGYATIVDILLELDYLTKQNYEKWRLGKVPYLEKVCIVNLNKLQLILKTAHSYATKQNYKKSITFYKKYKSKKTIKLRFSASNNEKIEQLYSTHFIKKDSINLCKKNIDQNDYIVSCLKDIIKEFGPNYLNDKPFEVYQDLLKINDVDRITCSAILCTLVNNVVNIDDNFEDIKALSIKIQNLCKLNSKISNELANIFSKLYSKDNKKEFVNIKDNKLKDFLQSKIPILWNGYSVWHYSGGYIECFYKGDILLIPNKNVIKNKDLKMLLIDDPYASVNKIQEHFINELCKYLDNKFDDYCTCEKYYEPVVEEFSFESNLEDWCNINRFKILKCEGSGYDGGYTPAF